MNDTQFTVQIHAPAIDPRHRHPKIFETFDGLNSGEFMELSNDHDPKPLHYQFMIEREGTFLWEYLEEGPAMWRVAIGKK
ncbi:Uncharacterized conserved protein, DUF2249 family [Lentibacillus persicus]|uniref:Uncharacterized conserved protein, DUF2249 family n=1 Tax=Lentibacillus persicus TaxID=640948 RepID=A0A1I1RW71_9BACI|nr:DUF2249 domain-containing protein [Lentibacillus persicus]SFD38337.1 Uncharacterized conserved protein, DUF2249 family [Lentibacillus persicus]